MTAIIIDDEADNQEVIRILLAKIYPEINVVGQYYTATEGQQGILVHQPDLVFLDIGLPDKSGFDLLRELDEIKFSVIFVSAHEQYAAQAFRWSAVDFLVKPVTESLLREAVEKAVEHRKRPSSDHQLRMLLENISSFQKTKTISKLALPTVSDIEFVHVKEIIRIEGDKNYSTFYLSDKRKITVSKTLGEYEKMLENTSFMRIQKSHIVNMVHIKRFIKGDGGWVLTTDGAEVPVSPLKKDALLAQLSFGFDE